MRSTTLLLATLALSEGTLAAYHGIQYWAAKKGKYFGTATDNPELNDSGYVAVLNDNSEFGMITVGNTQKWQYIEPNRNQFDFSQADVIVNQALAKKQRLRCHTLVWHSQLAGWVQNGNFNNATLISIIQNHIKNVVTHYKGKCYAWDVVNEAFEDDGTYRKSVFYNTIGPAYIAIAFRAAAAADPAAKLYYNDYNIESPGSKSSAAIALVKQLKAQGVRIDGVGLQAHLISGQMPSLASMKQNMANFIGAGVGEVALTELDIRMNLPTSAAKLATQQTDYNTAVAACVQTAKCVGVTVWDWTDRYSWIPSVFGGQGAALPWDAYFVKKPAYTGILNAFTA